MEFRILGPLEAIEAGEPLKLGGTRQRALLALLLTRANEAISSDRLIEDLWEKPPKAAKNVLQTYVSHLRKTLGPDVLVTQSPGYLVRVSPGQLDLDQFEELVEHGRALLEEGRAEDAARELRAALKLWRGPPLADFAYEPFALTTIARLEELRLVAIEWRVETDLALGRHDNVAAELEQLTVEHPLRERLRAQLMLALYRSGRQAEALESYQQARQTLVEQLGIDPSQKLQDLEKAILRQEPSLDLPPSGAATQHEPTVQPPLLTEEQPPVADRSILVAPTDSSTLSGLLAIAEPIARKPAREIILARLLPDENTLAEAMVALRDERDALLSRGLAARVAAFTSPDPGEDLVRMATEQDVDLLLIETSNEITAARHLAGTLATVLDEAPCDVAVVALRPQTDGSEQANAPVFVPFGGSDNDWAAVEIGAWVASSRNAPLRLLGTRADGDGQKRDASRLLASVSLMIQRVTGVIAEPLLIAPGPDGVIEASHQAQLIVTGLADDWRTDGIGDVRASIASDATPPVMLIRGGLRPGGLAPDHTLTRFTWTIAGTTV